MIEGIICQVDLSKAEIINVNPKIIKEVNKELGITQKDLKAQRKMWCSCKKDYGVKYFENNKCKCGTAKHHYHCLKCNKLTQIG